MLSYWDGSMVGKGLWKQTGITFPTCSLALGVQFHVRRRPNSPRLLTFPQIHWPLFTRSLAGLEFQTSSISVLSSIIDPSYLIEGG